MKNVQDYSYEAHEAWQAEKISPQYIQAQAGKLIPSTRFVWEDGAWHIPPYPGFSLVSMIDDSPGNEALSSLLSDLIAEVEASLDLDKFYFLPTESYHQTLANMLSGERYQTHIADPRREGLIAGQLAAAFDRIPPLYARTPIRMRITGLGLLSNVLALLGHFPYVRDYEQIIDFREHLYGQESLAGWDIKMTRPFVAHISLAYLGAPLTGEEQTHLAEQINRFNEEEVPSLGTFRISGTELRRYDDLCEFVRHPGDPAFSFYPPPEA